MIEPTIINVPPEQFKAKRRGGYMRGIDPSSYEADGKTLYSWLAPFHDIPPEDRAVLTRRPTRREYKYFILRRDYSADHLTALRAVCSDDALETLITSLNA